MFATTNKAVEVNGDFDEEAALAWALAVSQAVMWNGSGGDEETAAPRSTTPQGPPEEVIHMDTAIPQGQVAEESTSATGNPSSLADDDEELLQAMQLSLSVAATATATATAATTTAIPTSAITPSPQDEARIRLILGGMNKGRFRCIVLVDTRMAGILVGKNFTIAKEIGDQAGAHCSMSYMKRGFNALVDAFDASVTLLLIEADTPEAVAQARSAVEQRIADIVTCGILCTKREPEARGSAAPGSPPPTLRQRLADAAPAPGPPVAVASASTSVMASPPPHPRPSPARSKPIAGALQSPSASAATATASPAPAPAPPRASKVDTTPTATDVDATIRTIESSIRQTRPRVIVRLTQTIGSMLVGKGFVHTNKIAAEVGAHCRMRFINERDHPQVASLGSVSLFLIEADTEEALSAARTRVEGRIRYLSNVRRNQDAPAAASGPVVDSPVRSNGASSPPLPSTEATNEVATTAATEALQPVATGDVASVASGENTFELFQRILNDISVGRPRTIIGIQRGVGCLLVGKGYCKTNEICKILGGNCKITFISKERSPLIESLDKSVSVLLIEADSNEIVEEAYDRVMERMSGFLLSDEDVTRRPTAPKPQPRLMVPLGTPLSAPRQRYVLVDNSNVFIGAQNRNREGLGQDYLVRVNADALSDLLNGGPQRLPGTRIVAGSKPPSTNDIWQRWESAGYTVKVSCRDNITNKEGMVDEFLHAQAYKAVMQHIGDAPGENTLVLCTGDGNTNGGLSNFVDVARDAAYNGWRVEIWSWEYSLSQRFSQLANELPDRIRICLLDDHEATLIFRAKPRVLSAPSQEATSTTAATTPAVVAAPTPAFDDEDSLCIICMAEPRSRLILPCRHFTHCAGCATLLGAECHTCRGHIESIEIA